MSVLTNILQTAARATGYEIRNIEGVNKRNYADPSKLEKASSFVERYREIVSDPLNILIERVPEAGYVDENACVILHNGHRVPLEGDVAYYGDFSDILIINRGVHEPLEEYCFQQVLSKINSESPRMIELGSYWAHYSMWFLKAFPKAKCYMVEPDRSNMKCGKNNFKLNHYKGVFISAFVGRSGIQIDSFTSEHEIASLDILHSDIQGHEQEMLEGGESFLGQHRADYVFISTHSETLHVGVLDKLRSFGYRIEVSSGHDNHTTSCDCFVLASSPRVDSVFQGFSPLGRLEIANSKPWELLKSISSMEERLPLAKNIVFTGD